MEKLLSRKILLVYIIMNIVKERPIAYNILWYSIIINSYQNSLEYAIVTNNSPNLCGLFYNKVYFLLLLYVRVHT